MMLRALNAWQLFKCCKNQPKLNRILGETQDTYIDDENDDDKHYSKSLGKSCFNPELVLLILW